jgi:hypothetical protein
MSGFVNLKNSSRSRDVFLGQRYAPLINFDFFLPPHLLFILAHPVINFQLNSLHFDFFFQNIYSSIQMDEEKPFFIQVPNSCPTSVIYIHDLN